jgi:translocation and assembly module TamB
MAADGTAEARVQVRGDHFRAVNTTEATVDISPSLDLSLVERRIALKGDVVVPFAKIEILELPEDAVAPSKDVVFVDVEEKRRAPVKVGADVRVVLGDSVSFRGLGASGKFQGSLRVVERPARPTAATGELRFVDAQYVFLGQRLRIDPGRVFYAGGPLDNPGLDIRAYRELDNGRVRAGVNVRGTARNPTTTVFSVPPMSEADIMSYLLFGRPSEEGSNKEMMLATALTMGLQQGNTTTGGIGSSLGLDTASFEAGETVEETSFVAGKYLSPSLYVSYGVGVFDRIGSWKMRYSLTRRLTVQTETGRESGADLFYKFERGGPKRAGPANPEEKKSE